VHDGTVTFTAYDSKGRETERATFASSSQSATTRPALANASKVTSTKWHASFNLPTQVAEPHKITTRTYNAKGMLAAESWTATTDATGAAKFTAVKTGSTYATGWGYNANSLATSIVTRETAAGATVAVETGRWTAKYNAAGDMTQADNVTQRQTAKSTGFDAHGNTTRVTDESGAALTLSYDARGRLRSYARSPGRSVSYDYTAWGDVQRTTSNDGAQTNYEYNAIHQITRISESGTPLYPGPAATTALLDVCRTLVNLRVIIVQQCWIAPPIPSRPNDLLPREERYYDRHCKGSPDPCGALKAATMTAIAEAKVKMENMLSDPSRLFQFAFFEANPTVTGTNTTWSGHADDLHGRISSIWAMISLGRKMGCDMSAETTAALTLFVPAAPR
jgi:YD repeat-containing protein